MAELNPSAPRQADDESMAGTAKGSLRDASVTRDLSGNQHQQPESSTTTPPVPPQTPIDFPRQSADRDSLSILASEQTFPDEFRIPILSISTVNCFPCTVEGCPKKFKLKSTQKAHSRRHDLAFTCDKCTSRFGAKKELDRHKTTVHDKMALYPCTEPTCPYNTKPFTRLDTLQRHMGKVHGRRFSPPAANSDQNLRSATSKKRRRVPNAEVDEDKEEDETKESLSRKVKRMEIEFREMKENQAEEIMNLRQSHETHLRELLDNHAVQVRGYQEQIRNQQAQHSKALDLAAKLMERLS